MKRAKQLLRKSMMKWIAFLLVISTVAMSLSPATAEAAKKKSSKTTKSTHTCVAGISEPYTWSYCDRGDGATHAHAINSYIRCVTCKSVMSEDKYRAVEPHDYGTTGKCACGALQPHVHKAIMCAVVSDVYTPIENGHWLRRTQVEKCSCGAVMKTEVIDIDSPHDFGSGVKCSYCGHQCETVDSSRVVSETVEATEKGHYRIQDVVDVTCCGDKINGRCVKSGLESHSYEQYYDINHPHYLVEECSVCHFSSMNKNKKQDRDDCAECTLEDFSNGNRNGLTDTKEYEENVKKLSVPGACKGEEFVKGSKISETVTYVDLSYHARVVQYAAKCQECGGTHATDDSHHFSDVFLEAHTSVEDVFGTASCTICGANLTLKRVEADADAAVDMVSSKTGLLGDINRTFYYEFKDMGETLPKALEQMLAGNYTDDENITLTGTAAQIAFSFTYFDTLTNARDLFWDLTHWENEWGHFGLTVSDGLAIALPAVNAIDELLLLSKLSKVDVNASTLKAALNSDILGNGKNTVNVIKNGDKVDDIIEGGVAGQWYKATFNNVEETMQYHLTKHGKGRTIEQYTQDAMDFYDKNKHLGQNVILKDGTEAIKIQTGTGKNKVGGYWTKDGKLVTFWD